MKKYRFKTKEEFISSGKWNKYHHLTEGGYPKTWNRFGKMNKYLGAEIPEEYHKYVETRFVMDKWAFSKEDIVEFEEEEPSISELLDKFKQITSSS